MSRMNIYTYFRTHIPLVFDAIEIETTAVCNRACSFCPNSLVGRKKGVMKTHDVLHILDQLGMMRYHGRISLHMYGEPLLDKRLPSLVAYARRKCPEAFIKINSNGDFVTRTNVTQLTQAGMDLLYISQYDNSVQQNVKDVLNWMTSTRPQWVHHLQVRVTSSFSDNRAGLLPHIGAQHKVMHTPCYRPLTTMVINWEGNHVLCCNDYFGTCVIGSIHATPLLSLWFASRLVRIRKMLRAGKRKALPLCSRCSYEQVSFDGDNTNEEHFHLYGIFTSLFVPLSVLWKNSSTVDFGTLVRTRYTSANPVQNNTT